uniref:Transmembrane and ubiquitin-like domain containing 1 n=1 Tax=Astyanax mexicanus TaxID=7994 RepID=A0A8B9HAR1_ASTMX
MVLIEGVGDEVTLLFGVVFLVLVLVLAWISTHTAEPAEPSEHLLSTRPESAAPSFEEENQEPIPTNDISSPSHGLREDSKAETERAGEEHNSEEGGGDEGLLRADGLRRREAAGPSLATEPPASASRSTQPSPSEDTPNDTERNMVLRLKFLNDTERVAQVNPEDTIVVESGVLEEGKAINMHGRGVPGPGLKEPVFPSLMKIFSHVALTCDLSE